VDTCTCRDITNKLLFYLFVENLCCCHYNDMRNLFKILIPMYLTSLSLLLRLNFKSSHCTVTLQCGDSGVDIISHKYSLVIILSVRYCYLSAVNLMMRCNAKMCVHMCMCICVFICVCGVLKVKGS
jgi:hypothetical protein